MQEQPRNRDWVKNAAIIFLVVLLVLTFFSNTIMNRSLPEVATQEVESGSIVARVRGTGTVQANSNTQVKMDRTRVIRSVLVKVGQKVEAGDVLFTLGEGASEEIDAAEEKLQSLQASYNRTAATIPDFSYSADQLRIKSYEDALADAQWKVDEIESRIRAEADSEADNPETGTIGHHNLKEAADRLAAAKLLKDAAEKIYQDRTNAKAEELDQARREAYSQELAENIAKTQEALSAAQSKQEEYDSQITSINALELEKSSVEDQIAEIQRLIDNYGLADTYNTTLADLKRQLESLNAQMAEIETQEEQDEAAKQEIQNQINSISNQITELEQKLASIDPNDPNAEERMALEQQIQSLKDEQNRLSFNLQAIGMNDYNKEEINNQYTTVTEQIKAIEDQASTVDQTKEELQQQLSVLEQKKYDLENSIQSKTTSLPPDPSDEVTQLANELANYLDQGKSAEEIEEKIHELANISEADLDKAVEYLNKCQEEYDAALAAQNSKYNSEWQYAKEALRAAQLNYDTAKASLREKISSNETTLAGYNADLANLWQQIQRAQEKLDDLLGGEEATVTAKVAGTIQTLDASPGDTKKKDDVIATIEAPDMGYTMSFSVTNDQANRLRVGDTGTVSNFYWGSEITATLRSIQIDQKNPQTNKLLTFDLSGNVTTGTELTVSVGQKSANYDVIIPSSSVRTDANGTYVLKLESKNSPLGNRYLARRVPVEVLAVDDTNSAVSADLGYGDYVITSSSSPLKNGQLVRLATSG